MILLLAPSVVLVLSMGFYLLRPRSRQLVMPAPWEIESKIRHLESPHWANPWEEGWHESQLICGASCCRWSHLVAAVTAGAMSPNEARS